MANPFTSISCTMRYDNARLVCWNMLQGADYPSDFAVQIENCRAGGDWFVLADGLAGSCSFVDSRKRNYNKRMNECYRLRLTSASTGENWVSAVVDAGNHKAFPYSADAENVVRQLEIGVRQSGCPGNLMKRRLWGPRCPDCTDFAGQQTVNEHCPRCLGTGIDGGYFPGIRLGVIKESIQVGETSSEIGYMQGERVTAKCVAYPWISRGDVWCEDGTNNRYVINSVTPIASYKTTHLLYAITMDRVEYSDILHSAGMSANVTSSGTWTAPGTAPGKDDPGAYTEESVDWDAMFEAP